MTRRYGAVLELNGWRYTFRPTGRHERPASRVHLLIDVVLGLALTLLLFRR